MKKFIYLISLSLLLNISFSLTPDDALEIMKKSSKSQKLIVPDKTPKNQVVASILLCSDMDTKINTIFNITKDKIYTVNVLGNVALEPEIASLEYSVIQLESPLIIVLGHYPCDIINDVLKSNIKENTIQSIKETLDSSVERARLIYGTNYSDTLYKQSIVLNVYYSMENLIKNSKIVKNLLETKKIKIIGAVYNEKTGYIEWLNEHPMQQEIIDGTYNSLEFLALYKDKSKTKEEKPQKATSTTEKKDITKPIQKTNTPKQIVQKPQETVKTTKLEFVIDKLVASPRKPSYITMIFNTFKNATKIKLEVYSINTENSIRNPVFILPSLRVINGRAQAQFYFAGRKFKRNLYLPKGKYKILAKYTVFSGNKILETKTKILENHITLY
ncbi:MAG: carbonic anhydrase [Brevinematia bacterium]